MVKPLVKDKRGFLRLQNDLNAVMLAFTVSRSRLVEKSLADLMDQIYDEVLGTLTDYGQWFVGMCGDLEPFEAVHEARRITKRDRAREKSHA
jgi:hypothetical protein